VNPRLSNYRVVICFFFHKRSTQKKRGMSGEGKVVCVTGASGYIASWLVKLLLQRGYTVKATVRDPNDQKKTEHLRALDGAKERLLLFKANLLEDGAFDPVVDGCDGVFHTASPVSFSVQNPQADLIEPALKGTLNVLKSCAKVPSIKRVVLTASMASVAFNGTPLTPDVVVDETWFSDPAYCEKTKLWYMLSKTLAEEAAWKFTKANGIDMVVINPGWGLIHFLMKFIDILMLEMLPMRILMLLKGFQLVVVHISEALKIVHELYPSLPLPEKCGDDKPFVPKYEVSKEKAKQLGIDFTPLEKMSGEGKKIVCVTGGSGYIASWLIKHLLQRGYTVKATVRDTSDPKKTDHLLALDGAKERLQLFNANLLEEGSFDAAVDGCEGVFHTASPVTFFPTDPQAEVLDPAVKGTLNVLKSCARVPSIKRVILTSSTSAVVFHQRADTPDMVVDESFYSDTAFCRQQKLWYPLAKTLAEEAARNFAEENGLDLVITNPGFEHRDTLMHIICPWTCGTLRMYMFKPLRFRLRVADIIIGECFPTLLLPDKAEEPKVFLPKCNMPSEKVKTLGVNFIPLEVTLRDTIESLIEKGFLHRRGRNRGLMGR
ncbi:hypothetical protein Tsubulata_032290, partial [Turnera subulata]